MAVGNYTGLIFYGETPTNVAYGQRDLVPETLGFHTGLVGHAVSVNTQPVDEVKNFQVGNHAAAFGFLDFYNRIHLQYTVLGLGAVVSDSEVPFRIFNAFFVPVTLESVIGIDDDGLTIVQPATPPYDFQPLQELTYILQAASDGPPVIGASYTFDFGILEIEMEVTGIRVLGWRWSANWIGGVTERLEWLTGVMEARNDEEQRRQLRSAPRQFVEFTFDVRDKQQRIFENQLYLWGSRTWALPFWPDGSMLTTPVSVGSTVIALDTTSLIYRAGELAMLIAPDDSSHEAVEIDTVSDTQITLVRPISIHWPSGTLIYPARLAVLENAIALRRFLQTYGYAVAQFRCTKTLTGTALTETTYRGYPIFVDNPNWEGDPEYQYERKLSILDPKVGPATVYDLSDLASNLQGIQWTALNRTEIKRLREWLYARAGRAKAVWVPTFSEDLILVDTIGAASPQMDLEFTGLVDYTKAGYNRRDIRIELYNGTVFYRRISGPVAVDANTERVTLDSALGIEVTPAMVRLISWLSLVRLDSDTVELSWKNNHILDASLAMRSFRHDV